MKQTIRLPNQETYAYRTEGRPGNPVLCLVHGNMSSSFHFQPIMSELARDFYVVAPDLRGLGDSTYHTPIDSLHDLAGDLKRFLDALGLAKASFVGWSTGGGVVLSFAARYPEATDSIVLMESASVRGYPVYRKDARLQPIPTELYQDKASMAADPVQVAPVVRAMETKDHEALKRIWLATVYNMHVPKAVDAFVEESLKQRNLVDIDWALMTFNMSDSHNGVVPGDGTARAVQAPILITWGRKDLVLPEFMFQQNGEAFPEAERLILDHGSHSPLTDEPDTIIHAIRDFLRA